MDDCKHDWRSLGPVHRIRGISSETREAIACRHCDALGVRARVSNRKSKNYPLTEASEWYAAAARRLELSKSLAWFLDDE